MKHKLNILLFVISILILTALIIYGNPSKLIDTFKRFDLTYLAILFVLAASGLALRFLRFKLLLNRKYKTTFSSLFPAFIFGISLANITPGRVAEPVRALLVKKTTGIPATYSLACIFLERLSDMVVILALASFAFLAIKAEIFILPFLLALAAISLVIIATQWKPLYIFISDLTTRTINFIGRLVFKKRMKQLAKKIASVLYFIYDELKISKGFILQLVLALLIWGGAYSSILYFSLQTLGVNISFTSAAGIYTLSLIVGLASFLPGGLGSAEAATAILLNLSGVEFTTALAASIITRALTLWDVILLGPICSLFIKEKKEAAVK